MNVVPSESKERRLPQEPKLRTFIFAERFRHVTIVFTTNFSPVKPDANNQVVVVRYGAATFRPNPSIVPRDPRAPDYAEDNIFDPKDKFGRRVLPQGLKQVPTPLPPGFKRNFRTLRRRHREEAASRYWRAPSFGVVNLAKFKPPVPNAQGQVEKKRTFAAWFRRQVRGLLYTQGNYGERLAPRKVKVAAPAPAPNCCGNSAAPPQLQLKPEDAVPAPSVQEVEEIIPQLLVD